MRNNGRTAGGTSRGMLCNEQTVDLCDEGDNLIADRFEVAFAFACRNI